VKITFSGKDAHNLGNYASEVLKVMIRPLRLYSHLKIYDDDGLFYTELIDAIRKARGFLEKHQSKLPGNFYRDCILPLFVIHFDIGIPGTRLREAYFRNCLAGKYFSKTLLDDIFEGELSDELVRFECKIFEAIVNPLRMRLIVALRDEDKPLRFKNAIDLFGSKRKALYHLKKLKDQEAVEYDSSKIWKGKDFVPILAAMDLIEEVVKMASKEKLTFDSIMYSKDDFERIPDLLGKKTLEDHFARDYFFSSLINFYSAHAGPSDRETVDRRKINATLMHMRRHNAKRMVVFSLDDNVTFEKLADVMDEGHGIVLDKQKNIKGYVLPQNASVARQICWHILGREKRERTLRIKAR